MALSTAAREALDWIVDYLTKAGAPDSIPVSEEVAHKLSVHHTEFGFDSQIGMLEELHDAPVLTLIKIILVVGE